MSSLSLHEFHEALQARFTEVNGVEVVAHYGDVMTEYAALRGSAGVLDLSFRGRLCLIGEDRHRFLNGQVTNDVNALQPGGGCHAALITAKGKMQGDLNVYRLEEEILLDFEPGLSRVITQRLEKYIIADDVEIIDVAPHFGLLSVQGPRTPEVVGQLGISITPPGERFQIVKWSDATLGDIYLANQARGGGTGMDLFVPAASLGAVSDKLIRAAAGVGGKACGWDALEMMRIEAGIPRFGVDMDETNLPPETGLESRAISYTKGCYIGQEVIARIRTYGQVAKALRGLRLGKALSVLPKKGDKLYKAGREVGYITSALDSPACGEKIALGYVRREANQPGTELTLRTSEGETAARIVPLPFAA